MACLFNLGWISKEEISYNPFLRADSYDKIYVKDFTLIPRMYLKRIFFIFKQYLN